MFDWSRIAIIQEAEEVFTSVSKSWTQRTTILSDLIFISVDYHHIIILNEGVADNPLLHVTQGKKKKIFRCSDKGETHVGVSRDRSLRI